MIYLDHAATSWPKPPEVLRAVGDFFEHSGGNPGRAGHRLSIAAGRVVWNTRETLARLFDVPDPERIVFTANATAALNLVLRGVLRPGDRVVASGMEHNAVMRPLRALEKEGVRVDVVFCARDGTLNPVHVAAALRTPTRLLVTLHASNVTGTLLPIEELAQLAHQAGARILVDAAQTAGAVPISVRGSRFDFVAFTGHKALQGPPGTGGLVLGDVPDDELPQPLIRGGTGSRSEFEEQPTELPDRYESGTVNGVGLAALGAGARWVLERGVAQIQAHEQQLTRALLDGLAELPGIQIFGPRDERLSTAIVSFSTPGRSISEFCQRLDDEFGVLCRVGLHCGPAAHRTIGSFPEGTIRLAPGPATTLREIHQALLAIRTVLGQGNAEEQR